MKLSLTAILFFVSSAAFSLPKPGQVLPNPETFSIERDTNYNFNGIVKLDNCSGSLIKFGSSLGSDKAMVLTNGHCVSRPDGGFIKPDKYLYNESTSRSFRFLKPDGSIRSGSVSSTKILYATMTGTDMAIYQLSLTYDEMSQRFDVDALVLSDTKPSVNDQIEVLSGYWQTGYSCHVDGLVYMMKEDAYTWFDSVRYSEDGCHTIHGTSGSPVIGKASGEVVAINNTGNDDGERCTMNNPCEVTELGQVTYKKGLSYAQQTYVVYSCLTADRVIDLTKPGCKLFHSSR